MAREVECPYPPQGSSCLIAPDQPLCPCTRKPIMRCRTCGALNRIMARFCRSCGAATDQARWSCRGGEATSPLLDHPLSLPTELPVDWEARLDEAVSTAPLMVSGLMTAVTRSGHLAVFAPGSSIPLSFGPVAGVGEVVASPAALPGLLLVASQGKLVVIDLVEMLEVSPGATSRRTVLPLAGNVCSHLTSDGQAFAAVATVDDGRMVITLVGLEPDGSVERRWSLSPSAAEADDPFVGLCCVDSHLLVSVPSGELWLFDLQSGQQSGRGFVPEGLTRTTPLGRSGSALLAASDGAIHMIEARGGLRRTTVAPPVDRPLYALGASHTMVVVCHGRFVRIVELRTGRVSELELPQHCTVEPLVGRERAAVVSSEGTLYLLGLGGGQPTVVGSRKLFPAQGSVPSPPVAGFASLFACGPAGEVTALSVTGGQGTNG